MTQIIIWNISSKTDETAYMPGRLTGFHPVRTCGPYQMASWLRSNGYTVKVIDFCDVIPINDLVNITKKYIDKSTLVIGVSTTFLSFLKSHLYEKDVSKDIKHEPLWLTEARSKIESIYPKIKWVAGGKNTWACDVSKWIQFNGDSEGPFLKFLNELTDKKTKKVFDVRFINKTFLDDDYITPYDVLPIEIGRGCMFKCKFCSWDQIGKKPGTYLRDFNLIKEEILEHHYRWGTTRFTYVDDTVNETVDKVELLANIAKSVPFKLEWVGYIRADLMWAHPHTVDLLKESGLRSPFFGIESFNKDVSKLIGKGWSGRYGKEYLLHLKEYWGKDVSFEIGLLIGLPGQTIKELEIDVQWLVDNDIYSWWLSSLVLIRNGNWLSEFNTNSQKYGFSFPHSTNDFYWENGEWSSTKAYDVYKNLRNIGENDARLASFGLSSFSSIGYQFDDLMHVKYKDLFKDEIYLKREIYLKNYITKSLQ